MIQVFVFREKAGGGTEFLMIKRAPDEPVYPNMWQMVTGYIEEGETAYEAARRELEEETGIRASSLWVVPYIASFYNARNDTVEQIPVFAMETDWEAAVALSHEHSDQAWLDYESALSRLVFPGHIEGLRVLHDYLIRGKDRSLFVRLQFDDPAD